MIWYHGPEGMKAMTERLQPKLGKDTNISKWHIGVAFVGEEGIIVSDYGKIVLSPGPKYKDYQRPKPSIPKSVGHYKEWIDACKGKGKVYVTLIILEPSSNTTFLATRRHRAEVGKEFDWDAENLKITNDQEANELLSKSIAKVGSYLDSALKD